MCADLCQIRLQCSKLEVKPVLDLLKATVSKTLLGISVQWNTENTADAECRLKTKQNEL